MTSYRKYFLLFFFCREEVEDRLKKGISNVLKKLPMEGSGIKKIKIVEEDDNDFLKVS